MTHDTEFGGPEIEFIRSTSNVTFEQYSIRLNGGRLADLQYMHGEWNLAVYGQMDRPTGSGGWREEKYDTFKEAVDEIIRVAGAVIVHRTKVAAIRSCRECGHPYEGDHE